MLAARCSQTAGRHVDRRRRVQRRSSRAIRISREGRARRRGDVHEREHGTRLRRPARRERRGRGSGARQMRRLHRTDHRRGGTRRRPSRRRRRRHVYYDRRTARRARGAFRADRGDAGRARRRAGRRGRARSPIARARSRASGAVAAFAVGTIVFGGGGWRGAAVLFAFFIPSALLSHRGYAAARRAARWQVLANGGVAACCALLAMRYRRAVRGGIRRRVRGGFGRHVGHRDRHASRAERRFRSSRFVPSPSAARAASRSRASLATIARGVVRRGRCSLRQRRAVARASPPAASPARCSIRLLGASLQALRYCPACACECETRRHACGSADAAAARRELDRKRRGQLRRDAVRRAGRGVDRSGNRRSPRHPSARRFPREQLDARTLTAELLDHRPKDRGFAAVLRAWMQHDLSLREIAQRKRTARRHRRRGRGRTRSSAW